MMMLISPAKTLDESPLSRDVASSQPRLTEDRQALLALLKAKDSDALQLLMHISESLGDLNYTRYQSFPDKLSKDNAKPALFSFQGDVYRPIKADMYDDAQLQHAQTYLRILSGLYGLLRPLDLLYPYRLEMGTPLENDQGKNLYDFWGNKITQLLNEDIRESKSEYVLNLASQEYIKAINAKALSVPMIDITFKEKKDDRYRVIGIHAKRARGLMVDMIIRDKCNTVDALKAFDEAGYVYAPSLSSENELVFTRDAA